MSTQTLPARPRPDEYAEFYAGYIERVPDGAALALLQDQRRSIPALLRGLSPEQAGHRYAPGKWSVKEVVGHMCDVERVMAYRALRIARGDETPLAGFEQDDYVETAGFDERALPALAAEFERVRDATTSLFRGLSDDAWGRRGTASGAEVTVRALAYIIAGHAEHHMEIIRTRYLGG